MTVSKSPTTPAAGSTGNTLTFTFTSPTSPGQVFGPNSVVTLDVPSGWTQPTTSNVAGRVVASLPGSWACTSATIGSITGSGPWTIPVTCRLSCRRAIYPDVRGPGDRGDCPHECDQLHVPHDDPAGFGRDARHDRFKPHRRCSRGAASKLDVTAVNGGANPIAGTGFAVVVQAEDAFGNPSNVGSNTGVSLSLNTGTGVLGGTLTGTIASGSNLLTISGVTYTRAEAGVILTVTRTSGASLAAGNSDPFAVDAGSPTKLAVISVNGGSSPTAGAGFPVVVQSQDAFGNPSNVSNNMTITLTRQAGTPTGTLVARPQGRSRAELINSPSVA